MNALNTNETREFDGRRVVTTILWLLGAVAVFLLGCAIGLAMLLSGPESPYADYGYEGYDACGPHQRYTHRTGPS